MTMAWRGSASNLMLSDFHSSILSLVRRPANFGDILLLKLLHQPSQLVLSAARGEVTSVHHEPESFVVVPESAR